MEVEEDPNGTNTTKERLVHFDLKGAPPRIEYYEQILPLLKKWGATGLLIEYEDMFPYWGKLKTLRAKHVYSMDEIEKIQEVAQRNQLKIIPLVQTFGHFEFVLKHQKFKKLREVARYPMVLCPRNEESFSVVCEMIDQMVKLHPDSKHIHIGADEVYHIGCCANCIKYSEANSLSKIELFFEWNVKVLKYIKEKYPHLQSIMWDDIFREADLCSMKASGIGDLVEPMVWYYQRMFNLTKAMWDIYQEVFSKIWVASAFKGATGPCKFLTDISYHLENNCGWLELIKQGVLSSAKFRGYTITGWQRYDHYAVLCELFPTGLPSLALCLLTLQNGDFTKEVHQAASDDLGFKELLPLNPFQFLMHIPECNFPGYEIFVRMQVLLIYKTTFNNIIDNDRINGWMTPYHVKRKFINPAHLEHFLPEVTSLLNQFTALDKELEVELLKIFYEDVVKEVSEVLIKPHINKLRKIIECINIHL